VDGGTAGDDARKCRIGGRELGRLPLARILEGGSAPGVPEAARPVAVQTSSNGGDKTKRVWP